MRVRLASFHSAPDPDVAPNPEWLKQNTSYHVISMLLSSGRIKVQVVGEQDDSPGWWDIELFEIIEHKLPPSWSGYYEEKALLLTPARWNTPGFWERYFEGDPAAIAIYRDEVALIVNS